ncbi:MAG: hypothetical protein AAFO81_09240 [Pseudomonadota bacterium]
MAMRRIPDTADSIVITRYPWGYAVLVGALILPVPWMFWQQYPAGELTAVKVGLAIFAGLAVAFAATRCIERVAFIFDAGEREIRLQRHLLGKTLVERIPFDRIEHLALEVRHKGVTALARVVVYKSDGDIPLASYSVRSKQHSALAERLRTMVFGAEYTLLNDLVTDSVHAMVSRGQLLNAALHLAQQQALSINEARRRVGEIAATISSDLNSG